jgi:hypothetical protein
MLTQDHVCEPDAQHRLQLAALQHARRVEAVYQQRLNAGDEVQALRGIDNPAQGRRSLSPQIILFVSEENEHSLPAARTVSQCYNYLLGAY